MIRGFVTSVAVVGLVTLAAGSGSLALAANPCAAKNPCAVKGTKNPCAAKNPCATKNPCAAKQPAAAPRAERVNFGSATPVTADRANQVQAP